MGYDFQTLISPQTLQPSPLNTIEDYRTKYLLDLYNQINELHTRHDIKILLRKCVYCILLDDDSNEEILFLNEVKKLLNEIKGETTVDHLEIISVIDEIYHFAVDKKIDDNLQVEPKDNMVSDELLCLFEISHNILQEGEDEEHFVFEEECGEEGHNDEEAQDDSSDDDAELHVIEDNEGQEPVWRAY